MNTTNNSKIFNTLLEPLPDNNGVGFPVHLEYIYDQIKEARREDDPQLSQGVWITKPKTPDWNCVIDLSKKILTTKSKDLQVCGWLIEGWIATKSLQGTIQGITFLNQFCQNYWATLYPNAITLHTDDGLMETLSINPYTIDSINDDLDASMIAERRHMILEWMDKTFSLRMLDIEIVQRDDASSLPSITLRSWIDAIDFDKKIKRNPKIQIHSPSLNIESCKQRLNSLCKNRINEFHHLVQLLHNTLDDLKQTLSHCDLPQFEYFSKTTKRIQELALLITQSISHNIPNNDPKIVTHQSTAENSFAQEYLPHEVPKQNNSNTVIIGEREDAYNALEQICNYLLHIEPHSPSPQLLSLMITWKDKSLVQIIQDIKTGITDAHLLFRLLLNS